MFAAHNPINYLQNRVELDNEKCAICFSVSLEVFRCAGPCQKIICISCVDRFASNHFSCKFCNDIKTFSWDSVGRRDLIFECPYDRTHATFPSLEEFTSHCFSCPFMKPQDLQLRDKVLNYQCNEGHQLIFLSETAARRVFGYNFFSALTKSECKACREVTLCRSYCPQCSIDTPVVYCVKCRFPPTTKAMCPIGHELKKKTYRSATSICDFCGYGDRFSTELSYSDSQCNFDICYRCHLKLEEENKLQPLKNEFEISKPPPGNPISNMLFNQASDSDDEQPE